MKDSALLRQYIETIQKYKRVTAEEEIELSHRIRSGDHAAKDKLIQANLRLVIKIALDLSKGSQSIMDVIQNGNMGLIKAAEKFDPSKGVRFSTYSAFWIKQVIMRGFIKPAASVSMSYRKDEVNKKIKHYIKDYYQENNSFPDIEMIEKTLGVKRRDAVDILSLFRQNGDIHQAMVEGGEDVIDQLQDNSYNPEILVEAKLMEEEVQNALDSFTERDAEIIKNRFGFKGEEKETLQTLGHRYAISAEATRQIERRAILIMRNRFPALASYYYAS